jgi:hypothetical protein
MSIVGENNLKASEMNHPSANEDNKEDHYEQSCKHLSISD